ncbi:hypothetical protein NHX12_028952 [Muraenolepis orangiensis]|uniref:Uncharacterized protein n=1 Tax=Muraenolepis orangiensis TaxID=630683 RepID=A0A9Q0IPB0_9TELE|nr:hypothetical protein NHX12_028952 [Muraenolepis orangiensis]
MSTLSTMSITPLTFPQWDVGPRKIRFIYLANLTSFRLTRCPNKSPLIPLYLGADIFSNTDIRVENHPRYHAKFAKKGYATKLTFSTAFRFDGLRVSATTNSLWFYSIQGLFRVAFELYSKQEQLTVMENLQDVWKSQINDSPLELNYNIGVRLDSDVCKSVPETCQEHKKVKTPLHSHHSPVVQESVDVSKTDTGSSGDTSADHNYCSFAEQTFQEQLETIRTTLSSLKVKLQSLETKHSSKNNTDCTNQLKTALLLLDDIDWCLDGRKPEERELTCTVLALLGAEDPGSVYSSHLMNSVAGWLGRRFHAANGCISQKVENFKVEHIERISDLPPADQLATELFPEAMRTLMLHWMGLSDEAHLEKRHSEYPILLLILEFANHNLITGAAHVLYSSLICR